MGLQDVAFGQVQKVQALQNPSSPVAAIKGHSLNECQPLELQLSGKKPKSAERLLVQSMDLVKSDDSQDLMESQE